MRTTKIRKWTEEAIDAVKTSFSHKEVMKKLGYEKSGTYFKIMKKYIPALNLDISHFKSKKPNQIKLLTETKKNEIFCINNFDRKIIKKYIITYNLLEYKCAICGLGNTYNGKPVTFQLDHINGINNDNNLSNLRLLDNNCHSQTDTYTGRNTKKAIENKLKPNNKCCDCGLEISDKAERCHRCAGLLNSALTIVYPSDESLILLIKEKGYLQAGKSLGISDTAIRKHLKRNNPDINLKLIKKENYNGKR